ncbi:MAG: hypothetical protein J5595_00330 [Bacteroidales bacterium]|nr:hypothetical protein [Bacteroidales bacterium]
MTPKLLVFCLALMFAATVASAQDTIKSSSVPKKIMNQYLTKASKTVAKKAVWTMTPSAYSAEYNGSITRIDYNGDVVWKSKKIKDSAIDSEVMTAYNNKYAADYAFQWAEAVTLANGEKRTFIIGRKGDYNYYFKYNDKKLMVEKIATCK